MTVRPMLIIMTPEGAVDTRYFGDHEMQGGCPRPMLIRSALGLGIKITLGHKRLVYQGKEAHLFCDEDGMANRLPINRKASRAAGETIVGPAGIWTGGME